MSKAFILFDWQVRPESNVLHSLASTPLVTGTLEPRLMHLLCFFAANQGSVISRETLIEEIWPKVIVNENSLSRAICELRKQLKDQSSAQYIQTIPKRGYRLCANVKPLQQARSSASAGVSWSFIPRWKQAYTGLLAVAACLAVFLSVFYNDSQLQSYAAASRQVDPMSQLDSRFASSVSEADLPQLNQFEISKANYKHLPLTQNLHLSDQPRSSGEELITLKSKNGRYRLAINQVDSFDKITLLVDGVDIPAIPVYVSTGKISDLQWAPLGNTLLFVEKTLEGTSARRVEKERLLLLELSNLRAKVIYEQTLSPRPEFDNTAPPSVT